MKKLLAIIALSAVLAGCTGIWTKDLKYVNILQDKKLSVKYNPDTKLLDASYGVSNDPAVEAVRAGADIYEKGRQAAAGGAL